MARSQLLLAAILLAHATNAAQARVWTDVFGNYKVDADLIAFSDTKVILERTDDKQLISLKPEELCQADRDYLQSKEGQDIVNALSKQMQTWTLQDGTKVVGRVISYGRKQVTIQRQDGKIYVNDRLMDNLPEIYQRMIPKIVNFFEKFTPVDRQGLEAWLVRQKGQPRTFNCEGVLFELENGDRYAVPFFFFSDEDQNFLKPGWEKWAASQEDYPKQDESAFDLKALAEANRQNSQASDQIARMQLQMQAVQAGVTNLWEVMLYPNQRGEQNLCVVAPGQNSAEASNYALSRNPGYSVGPIRKLNTRY
jgi:SLA1 homology domain 1, SHD1